MARRRVLVIDDEESPRESLRYILKNHYEVTTRSDGASGVEAVRNEGPFDVVLLDMKMPGMNGLETLRKLRAHTPDLPVIMVTAITDARTAHQAGLWGAADYLNKPFDVKEIQFVVERAINERNLRAEPPPAAPCPFEEIVGRSPALEAVFALVRRVMDTDTTVLITGETGTGKELVARALHFNSHRKSGPFVPVHCAAIPSELLESELFGHEKGAFTGAVQRRIGMFEAAQGGTLFLDEIGEMALGTQAKLLRAIQEREIRRVGSQETITINVRLVCATNRNLAAEVRQGRFREDLFYRINVVPVELPPLRARKEDIPVLVRHFAEKFAREFKRAVPQFTPAALDTLVRYPWPGNVRELQHAVERLLVTCDAVTIDVGHLPFAISQAETDGAAPLPAATAGPSPPPGEPGPVDLPKMTEELERKAIEEALRRADGVITEAARLLNITRRMLRYKIAKLGIATRPQPDDAPSETAQR